MWTACLSYLCAVREAAHLASCWHTLDLPLLWSFIGKINFRICFWSPYTIAKLHQVLMELWLVSALSSLDSSAGSSLTLPGGCEGFLGASGKKAGLEGMRGGGCGSLVFFLLQVKMKMTGKVNNFHLCIRTFIPPQIQLGTKSFSHSSNILRNRVAILFSYFVLFFMVFALSDPWGLKTIRKKI